MRWRFAFLVLVLCSSVSAQATKPVTLQLTLGFEELGDAPAKDRSKATITVGNDRKAKEDPAKLSEGANEIDLSLPDGTHHLYVRCPGFAAQHVRVKVEDG